MTSPHTLDVQTVTLAYGDREVVTDLNLNLVPNQITSIVGANGCGKSTLLRAMARLLKPRDGQVLLDSIPIHDVGAKSVARILGLLPQSASAPDGITVAELVGRGRHPHQRRFGGWTRNDYSSVASALSATQTTDLAERTVEELSGGQRQRVWIAMALAQETDILLLDEPTTFLDVAHQIEILDLLVDMNQSRATTIVMVLHDLNLAARYSDQLVAMRDGRIHCAGRPHEVISSDMVHEVFGIESIVIPDPLNGSPLVVPRGRHHVER